MSAAYNRGSALLSRDIDGQIRTSGTLQRSERAAELDENARLRERVQVLERELVRARRCLSAERMGRDKLRVHAQTELAQADVVIRTLTRIAFPGDSHD